MLKNLKRIIQYICKPAEVIFKIVEVKTDPSTNRSKVRYQAIGKSLTSLESLDKLFNSLSKIQGFSERESQYIIQCYQYESELPSLTLVGLKFYESDMIFSIRDEHSLKEFELSLDYFKKNVALLDHFSVNDVKKILNFQFEYSHKIEKELIGKSKKGNSKNILAIRLKEVKSICSDNESQYD